MKYSKIVNQVYKENGAIFLRYWWVFLGLSILCHTYQYLIAKFVPVNSEFLSDILFAYRILIYPIIVLLIMYLVECYNNKQLPKDLNKMIADAKRCYPRIILIYLFANLIKQHLGFGSSLIVFVLMYIKFPFLEQEIFFKNASLWKAIKNTNELTNREDVIKIITVLMIMFLFVYFIIEKINRITLDSDISYKNMILIANGVIKMSFFFFCKAVLTKVYTNIK